MAFRVRDLVINVVPREVCAEGSFGPGGECQFPTCPGDTCIGFTCLGPSCEFTCAANTCFPNTCGQCSGPTFCEGCTLAASCLECSVQVSCAGCSAQVSCAGCSVAVSCKFHSICAGRTACGACSDFATFCEGCSAAISCRGGSICPLGSGCIGGTGCPGGSVFDPGRLGPEGLAVLKAQLHQALQRVEAEETALAERMAPQTVEDAEALERHLQSALAEVRERKRKLGGQKGEGRKS